MPVVHDSSAAVAHLLAALDTHLTMPFGCTPQEEFLTDRRLSCPGETVVRVTVTGSQSAEPQLKDGSVYREKGPTI